MQKYTEVKDETEGLATKVEEEISKLPDIIQTGINNTEYTDVSPLERLKSRISQVIDNISKKFDEIFGKSWEIDESLITDSTPSWLYDTDSSGRIRTSKYGDFIYQYANGRAGGGRGYANIPYLVGDDAQRRPEIFVPDTDGTFLNGYQTERILNNINNSRNVGDVNIYVNSYGMNVAEVADELGAAFSAKMRMSGAML